MRVDPRVERTPAGLHLSAARVRDERLALATEVLSLALRDVAVLPTPQQQDVREAMRRLQRVQQWCQRHG